VGGVGFGRREDPQRRLTAVIGYWVGESYWGRGIATDALRCAAGYALERFDFERLEATVFDHNLASCRVLEKAGFALEGRLRRSVVKDGAVRDSFLYARVRDRRG
jgi:RimJ/RimL family protein N-acetyltransferase